MYYVYNNIFNFSLIVYDSLITRFPSVLSEDADSDVDDDSSGLTSGITSSMDAGSETGCNCCSINSAAWAPVAVVWGCMS